AEWKAELDKLEAYNATKHRLFNPFIRLKVWKLQELLQWWESVKINALNIPSMKPAYMIKHFKSLVGKDFKIIL
ncbi:hypothetical protein VP01_12041g1, partial [Puccinia sorghi]